MKKFLVIGLVALIVLASGCIQQTPVENMEEDNNSDEMDPSETIIQYTDVSAEDAKQLIDDNPDLIIIDVSPYYDNGHLPGAINYYPSTELEVAIPELDADAMYLIYCHADGPSMTGAQILVDAGFENVYRLESHFSGWEEAGYDIEE